MTAIGTPVPVRAPRAAPAARALSRATAVLLVLTVGLNALYLLGLIASNGANNPAVNIGIALATQWVPATVFWLIAVRTRFRRVPVVLAAAGITASAIGDTYYSFAMDADGDLPFPSLADPAYLLFYPLLVAALVALVRSQLRGVGRLVLLETAVATVGASAVLAVVLDPVIRAALEGDDPLAGAVAISYPLFDLMLLAVIAGVASAPTIRLGRRWWALIAGLLVTAVGDVAYALLEGMDTYLAGTPLDATWAVGVALMAWWVAGMAEDTTEPLAARYRRLSIPVPAFAVIAGLTVLVVATQVPVSVLAVVLAALTVGLGAVPIVFRQAILGRMLAAQEEAVRRLTALDQAKTDMMVTMNHAFRTPLTSITGHVELLLDGGAGDLPPRAIGMLETIERNGERLQTLIDDTLTSTRLDGPDTVVRETVDLTELAARAVGRLTPFATEKGVVLVHEPGERDLLLDADEGHLEQALVNVLGNAVKFTAAGGHVTVTTERTALDEAAVHVRDEGIGIPADDIPSVTSRFFRASNVQNAAIPGVGLGLSITAQVVRAHGGEVEIDSRVGTGTTVTVRLPLRRA
jgi:signal transduction histidine kinase